MRLPIRQPKAASILTLPDLAGGLNLRDGGSEILDNQLTECENMWWYRGALKTRPGIKLLANSMSFIGRPSEQVVEVKNFSNIKTVIDGEAYCLQVAHVKNLEENKGILKFFWCGESKSIDLGYITVGVANDIAKYFVFLQKKTLYCFTSDKKIYKRDIILETSQWEEIEKNQIYVPKIMMQCKKHATANISSDEISGVMLEGYNLLSDYYEMSYNSYNPEIVTEDNQKHKMQYHILKSVAKYEDKGLTVTAKITLDGVERIHTVAISKETRREGKTSTWEESAPNTNDKLLMRVWKNRISFYYCEENTDDSFITDKTQYDKIATISDNTDSDYWRNGDSEEEKSKPTAPIKFSNGLDDDIVIIAPYVWSNKNKEKIFNMTRCEWFGGATAGLSGGTRLFMCGNESEPSLVMWSGLNNPLYFPENSYFYVGDDTSCVTGFKKQSDMLVIFKENETWFTRYAQNTNITAQDLINQSVVDYTASAVYFPLVQINSSIGCGYPETIQLCRNRLVWLGNDKKLYTLVSDSQYNERNIFCASEMVEERLQKSVEDSQPSSCDWNGYYCLCLDNEMYLMDYNCYGYTHISSYSKMEDANIRIPWYYWKLPKFYSIGTINDKMFLSYYHDGESFDKCFIVTGILADGNTSVDEICCEDQTQEGVDGMRITERPIKSVLQTKIFDFGLPHIKKNIEQLNIQFTEGGSKRITLTTMSDIGANEDTVSLLNDKRDTAGFVESCAVFPCIKQIIRFGLKLECEGPFAIDSIVLKYRTLGGAR